MTENKIGIDDISFATSHHLLDLRELAEHQGVDVGKYYVGIGQSQMSVLAEDEDIVTMGAEAAKRIVDAHGADKIRTVLFATESGVDQSKAAGVYVHGLLDLPRNCRVVELKQACYSGTAALQFALGIVSRNPDEQVLVIASDSARYALDSSGESTQGAGAVAMLVTADPRLLVIEPTTGLYTRDVHDFWRPHYLSHALVDGKFSMSAYLDAVEGAYRDHETRGGQPIQEVDRFCYHQPFTKMAIKAHAHLQALAGRVLDREESQRQLGPSLELNRRVGNTYTASLFLGVLSLLNHDSADLAGSRMALFSYGSGAVAEYFTALVQPGYRSVLRASEDEARLAARTPLEYARYRELHERVDLVDGTEFATPRVTAAPFRLAGVHEDVRRYEPTRPTTP